MTTISGLELKTYWLSRCDGALPPLRSDMHPAEMKGFLSDLIIAETVDDGEYRIRLAGTRVVNRLGCDPTSYTISQNSKGVAGGIATLIETCRLDAGPVAGCIPYPDGVESFDAVNCTVLPLRDREGVQRQFIMALDFVFAATSLLSSVPADKAARSRNN